MHNRRVVICALCLVIACVLTACGGGKTSSLSTPNPPGTPPVSGGTSPAPAAPNVTNISAATASSSDCGASWAASLDQISHIPTSPKVDAVQILSWNDYEHGSQIEAGVDNCVVVAPAVSGTTLRWDTTGNTATIDHYSVLLSTDGTNVSEVATLPRTQSSYDLHGINAVAGTTYTLFVQAVGRPSFLNKISVPVLYQAAARTPPQAVISVSPTSGVAPLAVSVTVAGTPGSGSTITSTSIDFGDGTQTSSASATHTYTSAGRFTVTATVNDSGGLSSTATATVTVTAPNLPPVAKLSVTPTSGTAPLAVTASTAGSSDPDGTIASTSIDFGDGTVVNAASTSHTYTGAGTFTVRATVTDNGGLKSTATATVTVAGPNQAPIAKLSVTPTSGTAPLAVTASTAGSSDPDGSIASTSIDFGDGTVVNAASGSHTYTAAGTFTVRATVTDNSGLKSTATATVTVTAADQPPIAQLSVTPASGTAPVAVTASTAGSSDPDGTITKTTIDFGDGTVVTAASSSHTYSKAGTYIVVATVTDNAGVKSTATASVTVAAPNQAPVAKLAVTPTSGTAPVAVTATTAGSSDSDGTIVSTSIDFGDGTIVNAASGSHTYTSAGTFTVKATVTDNGGLKSTATATVSVAAAPNQAPVAKLSVTPTSGTAPLAVTASTAGSSDPDGTIASTSIDFGDGTVVNAASGSHTYSSAGTFTVKATVTDNGGLAAAATATVSVSTPAPPPPGGQSTHGMTIPATHPRIWWTPDRKTAAQAWLSAHPFTTSDPIEIAWKHVVHGDDCSAAVTYAVNFNPPTSGAACDDCRWEGDDVITIYDWCNDQFSAAQKSTFVARTNNWVNYWKNYSWPDASMPLNNYYVSYMRNDLLWGLASYGDNSSAESFIADAIDTRWPNIKREVTTGNGFGGVAVEGEEYDEAVMQYLVRAFDSARILGRDLWRETGYWRDLTYWTIYSTTPAPTYNAPDLASGGGTGSFPASNYQKSPFSDDEYWQRGGTLGVYTSYRSFMLFAANQWAGTNLGGYARTWWNNVGPYYDADSYNGTSPTSTYILGMNDNTAPRAFSSLPLDYYASGMRYFYARKAWDTSSAWVTMQMGSYQHTDSSHTHMDVGNFNIWRGGRWLMRESAGYGQYTGAASDPRIAPYHNGILINGTGQTDYSPSSTVRRLQSAAGYAYADVDLSAYYGGNHVEREYLFLRDLETLVSLDRITTASASTPRTMVMHAETTPAIDSANHTVTITNGTQVLYVKTLLPATATYSTSTGESNSIQTRILLADSGATQSYFLNVMQARDTSGSNLSASLVDSNPGSPATGTLTVTLHPATGADTVIVFNKGQTSSGGSVNGTALRSDVQGITYADSGPVWAQ